MKRWVVSCSVTLTAILFAAGGCNVVQAAQWGDLWRVRQVVEASPEAMYQTDENGHTPAVLAILSGHNQIAVYLIEKGYPLGVTDRTPFPLIMACLSRYTPDSERMLRYLLKRGADPNERYVKEGWLPLTMAVNNGMEAKVRLLAEHGADMALRERGLTAMELARKRLAFFKDPASNLPHGELSNPWVRARFVKQWEEMVALLTTLEHNAPRR